VISNHVIGAHVRAYSSVHGLNSNDKPSTVTAYSTRVERAVKEGESWKLTLRHLKSLEESHRINTTWWTEEFDAVVVATGPYDAPHVPEIDGLIEWSKVKAVDDPSRWSVYHSRVYRKPQRYDGKVRLSAVI
jgi:cation diffusion facilitator CzcD-associated flavoprotein CzcO